MTVLITTCQSLGTTLLFNFGELIEQIVKLNVNGSGQNRSKTSKVYIRRFIRQLPDITVVAAAAAVVVIVVIVVIVAVALAVVIIKIILFTVH